MGTERARVDRGSLQFVRLAWVVARSSRHRWTNPVLWAGLARVVAFSFGGAAAYTMSLVGGDLPSDRMSAFKRKLRNWRDEYAPAFNHILDDELTH